MRGRCHWQTRKVVYCGRGHLWEGVVFFLGAGSLTRGVRLWANAYCLEYCLALCLTVIFVAHAVSGASK